MKTFVIDTNALISFVTDRAPKQQEAIAALIEQAGRADVTILCPQNVLTEFVYVMEKVYRVDTSKIVMMIRDFVALPGVEVVDSLDLRRLFALWPDRIPDYGDAIVATVCLTRKHAAVATFDRKLRTHLQKIKIPCHLTET